MTPKEALQKAISLAGGQTELAARIGGDVRTGHIYYWLKTGRVPADYCPVIERITTELGAPVLCELLRPGVGWEFLRGRPCTDGEARHAA